MTSLSSLLIVHPGALGDLVCIFPIIAVLRLHFRPVAILCQGHLGRLAAAERLVDAWYPIEAAWVASLFTQTPNAEARHAVAPFSHILVFSMSEILASSLQHINDACIRRIPPRPAAGRRLHVTEHAVNCIRDCGWLPEAVIEAMQIKTPAPVHPIAVAQGHDSKTILLHPGAGSPRKRWPLAGFLEVAAQIKARRWDAEFVIGPAERDLLSEFESHGAIVHRPADAIQLLNLFRSAVAYVGNDSGASHLAAWTGLPSIVIFGPTDPTRWRPLGHSVQIVHPPLGCLPCFETAGANCAAEDCLTATTAQDVLDALDRLIFVGPSDTSDGRIPMPG
ncbi:MAG: glycosyltransferase family 9 protein [Desulfobacterales bacterium]|jgi:ADP-heptose:LPS heptosyltransferase|nr:glycosyltransferase family 9 protein [Desulfobacterales bacterium]